MPSRAGDIIWSQSLLLSFRAYTLKSGFSFSDVVLHGFQASNNKLNLTSWEKLTPEHALI